MKHRGIKITAIVNNKQQPLSISIDKAKVSDSSVIEPIVDTIIRKPKYIVGDKGYTSTNIKNKLKDRGINLIYPVKKYDKSNKKSANGTKKIKKNNYPKNTEIEKKLLKKRHNIENFFATLKQYRRLNFLYESKIKVFKGFVELAIILILIKKIT